jgi:hypothetical protein
MLWDSQSCIEEVPQEVQSTLKEYKASTLTPLTKVQKFEQCLCLEFEIAPADNTE